MDLSFDLLSSSISQRICNPVGSSAILVTYLYLSPHLNILVYNFAHLQLPIVLRHESSEYISDFQILDRWFDSLVIEFSRESAFLCQRVSQRNLIWLLEAPYLFLLIMIFKLSSQFVKNHYTFSVLWLLIAISIALFPEFLPFQSTPPLHRPSLATGLLTKRASRYSTNVKQFLLHILRLKPWAEHSTATRTWNLRLTYYSSIN